MIHSASLTLRMAMMLHLLLRYFEKWDGRTDRKHLGMKIVITTGRCGSKTLENASQTKQEYHRTGVINDPLGQPYSSDQIFYDCGSKTLEYASLPNKTRNQIIPVPLGVMPESSCGFTIQ